LEWRKGVIRLKRVRQKRATRLKRATGGLRRATGLNWKRKKRR
jgi:hypothetical protein